MNVLYQLGTSFISKEVQNCTIHFNSQILALFSISLIISPYNKVQPNNGKAGIIYSAYTGAILINLLIIVCHFLGERIPKKPVSIRRFSNVHHLAETFLQRVLFFQCLIISCFYGLAMLLAGFIIIQDWRNIQTNIYARQFKYHMDMLIASGVFSIFTSIAFFADIGLSLKYA